MTSLESRARRHDVFWGLRMASLLGGVLLLFATVGALLSGRLAELAHSTGLILLSYGGAIVVGGATLGLIRHRLDRWYWRCLVGVLAMLPISIATGTATAPGTGLAEFLLVALAISIIGGFVFTGAISLGMHLYDRISGDD